VSHEGRETLGEPKQKEMEKAADIILEAMGVKWQTMLAEAKAKADVREQLARLWQQGQK